MLKKIILLLVVLSAFALSSAAQLAVGTADASCGASVDVPVTLSGSGIVSIEFTVTYDASALTLTNVTTGQFTGGFTIASNGAPGSVHVAMATGTPVSGSGRVAMLTFNVADGAEGSYAVTPSGALVNDAGVGASAGSVSVNCVPAPGEPVNLEPSNGASGVSSPVTLRWEAAANASDYRVYFGSPSPKALRTIAETSTTVDVEPGKTYTWYVVARNSAGNSAGAPWTFTAGGGSCATPAAPVLNGPASGKSGQPYTLAWTASANATDYLLEESLTADFAAVVTVPVLSVSHARTHDVSTATTYYYRLRAWNHAAPCDTVSAPSNVVAVSLEPASGSRKILPIAGSAAGSGGSYFRTSVQLHNPTALPISGQAVFHRLGVSGSASDPALAYAIPAGQTLSWADIGEAMGVTGSFGSIDFVPTAGQPAALINARIYNDAGASGTHGTAVEAIDAARAIETGEKGILLTPADPVIERVNLGVRTLTAGATVKITLRTKEGLALATRTRSFAADYLIQESVTAWFDSPLVGSECLLVEVEGGAAIVYLTATENRTQDPTMRVAVGM